MSNNYRSKWPFYARFGLTQRQSEWCELFLKLGDESAVNRQIPLKKMLKRPNVIAYLDIRREQIKGRLIQSDGIGAAQELDTSKALYSNLSTLSRIISACVPNGATDHKEMNISGAISAIAEKNKMLGLYAPDKAINLQVGIDVKRLIEAMDEIEKRYIKEY